MMRNTAETWGSAAKTFHWLIVVLIATEVPAGLLMAATYGPAAKSAQIAPLHVFLSQWHHTVGFAILGLVVARLGWRLSNVTPAPDPATPLPLRWAARLTHIALYGLLALVPLSGWAALSVLGDTAAYGHTPIWLFGVDRLVPGLLPQQPLAGPFGYGFFGRWHRWLIYAGGGLLALHASAALWGHFIRRDDTLARMWPLAAGRRRRGEPGPG